MLFISSEKEGRGAVVLVGLFAKAMGFFFGCFRSKDSSSNLIAPREPVVCGRKNSLSSLFLSDDGSLQKGEGRRDASPQQSEVKQHKEEVKLVNTFGALLETPNEIQKPSDKWKDIPAQSREEKSSESHPDASSKEKRSDESPEAVKICNEWFTISDYLTESPSSCVTAKHSTGKDSSSSNQKSAITAVTTHINMHGSGTCSETSSVLTTSSFAPDVKSTNKPARLDCGSDGSAFHSHGSSSECSIQQLKQSESAADKDITNLLPFPSPRKSMDEMQALDDESPLYSVSKPVGDTSELKDKSSSYHLIEPLKMNDQETLTVSVHSVGNDMADEGSLSSWFKPISAEKNSNKKPFASVSVENVHGGKSSGDRPILGMVSAYWNEKDEPSGIPPKWWDGNGIPNSTNKYKEDQKVSWHATPFEERLEKALSEDTLISQRKPLSGTTSTTESHENEEFDTALSRLQSSNHLKSVVSF